MYEIDTKDIIEAQNKSEEALAKIVQENSRISMEHSEEVYGKRTFSEKTCIKLVV